MKKIFIPKGTIERHENLYADVIVVKGMLIASGIVRAKQIYGNGIIEAQRISANSIVADTLETEHISAKTVIANKILCVTATVSAGIIAKDYIEAHSVKTGRLTVSLSQIDKTEANEIIRLAPKRSFIGALFCSWLTERFVVWRHNRIAKQNAPAAPEPEWKNPTAIEYETLVNGYRGKILRGGYRLVLEPMKSEEAA